MARASRASVRLSSASLVHLGAPRLADILIEAGAGNANLKRRLRLEIAAELGPAALAMEINKRLVAIESARTRVSWRKRGELISDLETHRRMAVDRLAPDAPGEALAVLVRWFDLYPGLVARVKDTKGELLSAFEAAAPELFGIAAQADEDALRELLDAMRRRPQDYGRWLVAAGDAVSVDLASALLEGLGAEVGKSPAGRLLVRSLADRAQAIDLWLSLISPEQARLPDVAADIARRLLAVARTSEARAALEAALTAPRSNRRGMLGGRHQVLDAPGLSPAWEAAAIALLEAEGRKAEAQALRWSLFERDLSAPVLRDYLARLPDFDDVEALDRAFAHAADAADFNAAMRLFMDWPAHREAANLVLARPREAREVGLLARDWASRLAQRYPDAASLLAD